MQPNKSSASSSLEPFVLIKPEYVQEMFTPQFPNLFNGSVDVNNPGPCYFDLCQQYSLLSYITSNNNTRQSSCSLNTSAFVTIPDLPGGSLLAVGAMMRTMIVSPEEGLVVVSMGSSRGISNNCTGKSSWTSETSLQMSQIYSKYLKNATQPQDSKAAIIMEQARLHLKSAVKTAIKANQSLQIPVSKNVHVTQYSHTKAIRSRKTFQSEASDFGACYCYCGADAGVGRCFSNVSVADCSASDFPSRIENIRNISYFCPNVSLILDCAGWPDTPPSCKLDGGYSKVRGEFLFC